MITRRAYGLLALSFAGLMAFVASVGQLAGLRINDTESAPLGLWLVKKTDAAQLGRGALVEVCPPAAAVVDWMRERGYLGEGGCDIKVVPLLKPIRAIAGDVVELQPGRRARVNGAELPNTQALPFMPAHPAGRYVVQPGQVWIFSSYSAGSFDSRYFGPVPLSQVRGIARPLWVSGNTAAITTGELQ